MVCDSREQGNKGGAGPGAVMPLVELLLLLLLAEPDRQHSGPSSQPPFPALIWGNSPWLLGPYSLRPCWERGRAYCPS